METRAKNLWVVKQIVAWKLLQRKSIINQLSLTESDCESTMEKDSPPVEKFHWKFMRNYFIMQMANPGSCQSPSTHFTSSKWIFNPRGLSFKFQIIKQQKSECKVFGDCLGFRGLIEFLDPVKKRSSHLWIHVGVETDRSGSGKGFEMINL